MVAPLIYIYICSRLLVTPQLLTSLNYVTSMYTLSFLYLFSQTYTTENEMSTVSLGARMRKGLRNFCQGDSSTSTARRNILPPLLHRQQRLFLVNNSSTAVKLLPDHDDYDEGSDDDDEDEGTSFYNRNGQTHHRPSSPVGAPTPTLEDMIKQLELEEMAAVAARKTTTINVGSDRQRRSCVNTSSDRVLRSARNALNQYPPRFSLDGKDSMYRSSFLLNENDRRGRLSSACCCDVAGRSRRLASLVNEGNNNNNNAYRYDQKNVVWCRPGVVPKLMGLDAIPIPRNSFFAVYDKKAPVVLRKRRYGGGGDEDVERGIRSPEIRRPANR